MKNRMMRRALLLLALLLANAWVVTSQETSAPQTGAGGAQKSVSYLFVSPNTSENLTLAEALRKLNSTEEIALVLSGRTLACRLGLRARITKTIGSWSDGVEHSTLLRIHADEETVRYADAWLGKHACQKSVLYFRHQPEGKARMYIMAAPNGHGLARLAEALERNGIQYRTLVPGARRTLVYIVDLANELQHKVTLAARRLRARYRVLAGKADFIGDDTDRDRAQQVFSTLITEYEAQHPPVRTDCESRTPQQPASVISIAAARRLPQGETATIEGIVTVPSGTFKSSIEDEGFALQDRTGGIYVKLGVNLNLRVGQRVRAVGQLSEVNGMLALAPAAASAVRLRGRGASVTPLVSATGRINEQTEGRLVKVTGKITRAIVHDAPYGSRVFLDDGTGEIQVYVSASSNIDLSRLQPGQRLSAVGLSGQYKDHYEVEPRFQADIVLLP